MKADKRLADDKTGAEKLLLAIDCSFGGHSLALLGRRGVLAHEHHPRILPTAGLTATLRRALRCTNGTLDNLSLVCFGAGPGLFSGIRSACACAQGIAYTRGLRIAPVPTMRALAACHDADRIIAAYPAFRGHIYLSALERRHCGRGWTEHIAPALFALPPNLPRLEGDWLLCGKNLAVIWKTLHRTIGGKLERAPAWRGSLAPSVGKLASEGSSVTVEALQAKPLYVREKVAFTSAEMRGMKKR